MRPPPLWQVTLPDLRSRLAATPHVEIGDPDDALIGGLIVKLLGDRGIAAPPEVGRLSGAADRTSPMSRSSRSSTLLDEALLSHHRRITVRYGAAGADGGGHDQAGEKRGA